MKVICQTMNSIYLFTCSTCGTQFRYVAKLRKITVCHYRYIIVTTVGRLFNVYPLNNPANFEGLIGSILSFIYSAPDTKLAKQNGTWKRNVGYTVYPALSHRV